MRRAKICKMIMDVLFPKSPTKKTFLSVSHDGEPKTLMTLEHFFFSEYDCPIFSLMFILYCVCSSTNVVN